MVLTSFYCGMSRSLHGGLGVKGDMELGYEVTDKC